MPSRDPHAVTSSREAALAATVARLAEASVTVAAFVDAEPAQIEAAAACGFDACELHTGPWAEAFRSNGRTADHPAAQAELARLRRGGEQLAAAGLRFHGGHALTYDNVAPVAALPGLRELHIGHSIVARAIFVGLREAVRQMKQVIGQATEVQPCSSAAASTRPS